MSRGRKKPKRPGVLRYVLANNVRRRMDVAFASEPLKTNREKLLAKQADVSLSTVGRILAGETGASIDSIERIALALDCTVNDLLTPSDEVLKSLGFGKTPS